MPTITGTIRELDNVTPIAGVYVVAKLVPSTVSNPPGWVPTSPSNLVGVETYTTLDDGRFSLVLTDNGTITPAGTCYRFTYTIPGARPVSFYKIVASIDSDVDDLADADPNATEPTDGGGGDVHGPWGTNRIEAIHGIPLSEDDPQSGDGIVFDGTRWSYLPSSGGGAGVLTHLYAEKFGFGTGGSKSDTKALIDAVTEQSGLYTEQGQENPAKAVPLELPGGNFVLDPQADDLDYPGFGSLLTSLAAVHVDGQPDGGGTHLTGQGSGATTLKLATGLAHKYTLVSATRAGNVYTLELNTGGDDLTQVAYVGMPLTVRVHTMGRDLPVHYCVYAIPDSTHISFKAHDPDDGSGRCKTHGGFLDWGIPPTQIATYPGHAAVPVLVANWVTLHEYGWEFLNGSAAHPFFVDQLTFAGADVGDESDSLGARWGARVNIGVDFAYPNWWIGLVSSGTPSRTQGPENTDHKWHKSKVAGGCTRADIAFIDNSSKSWFRADAIGLGGGRDEHITETNIAVGAQVHILCNDAGSLETTSFGEQTNMKGSSHPFFWEGVDGLDRKEQSIIDRLAAGSLKIESPGNDSFGWDESGFGELHEIPPQFLVDMESGVDLNAADTGTPGGAGSVAQGQFVDATEKPWPVQDASLVTLGGMPTLRGTVPKAMFGRLGGRELGTPVIFGWAERYSGMLHADGTPTAYAADGVTVPGSGSSTIGSGSGGQSLPQSTINLAATAGMVLTSQYAIVPTTDGDQVVHFTGSTGTTLEGCTGGTGTMHTGDTVRIVGLFRSATVGFVAPTTSNDPISNALHAWHADAGLRIDSTLLTGGSDTIAQVNSSSEAVMSHAITAAATGQSWSVKNDGTKTQAHVCHEGRIKSVGPADSNGMVAVTMEYPIYGGPDLPGPFNAMAGRGGMIRCGDIIGTPDWVIIPNTAALDRMCHWQTWIDTKAIHTGGMTIVPDERPATRRRVPGIRVWDSITRKATADITWTNDATGPYAGKARGVSAGRLVAHGADIGRRMDSTGLAGGHDTIFDVVDDHTIIMSSACTPASNQDWVLHPTRGNTPFEFTVKHSDQQVYALFQHDDTDPSGILPGDQCELDADITADVCVRLSQSDFTKEWAGMAVTGSPAGCIPAIPTNGAPPGSTSARVDYDGPAVWVTRGSQVTSDDPCEANVAATLTGAAASIQPGTQVIDDHGKVQIPTGAGVERVIGQVRNAAPAGTTAQMRLRYDDKLVVNEAGGGGASG